MRRLLALAIFLLGGTAQAQTPSAADLLFREGRAASDAGDHARACRAFRASLELQPARGTRLNLALCQIQLGQLLEATQNLKLVEAQLGPGDERAPIVAESLAAIAKRLVRVELRFDAGLPDGAELRVDGLRVDLPSAGAPVVLDPGEHVFELSAPGRAPARVELSLAEGEARSVGLSLPPTPPSPPAAPPREGRADAAPQPAASAASNTRRPLGFVFLGLSGAGLVTAGVSGALMLRERGIVERECQSDLCSGEGVAAGARGRTLVVVTAVSAGVALASGVVGYYLLSSSPRQKSQVVAKLRVREGGLSLELAASL